MGSNGKLMKFYWNTFFCGIEWELVGIEWNFDGIWCDFMESCLDFTELYWNLIYIIGFKRFCWESNGFHSDMSMGSEDDQHQLWVSPRTGGIQHCKVMTMWILGVYGGTKILDLLKGHKKRQDSPALLAFPLGKCQVYHRLRKPSTEGYDQAISLPGYLQGMGVLNHINKSK